MFLQSIKSLRREEGFLIVKIKKGEYFKVSPFYTVEVFTLPIDTTEFR